MNFLSLAVTEEAALLVFVQRQCEPCRGLGLRSWQTEHAGRRMSHVISEEGEKHPIAEAYQYAGTPGAVLIKADRTIGSPVAAGEEAISKRVRR